MITKNLGNKDSSTNQKHRYHILTLVETSEPFNKPTHQVVRGPTRIPCD